MSDIVVSDILSSIYIVSVGFLKVKTKVNKKSEPRPGFIAVICFQMETQYKNLKYPI